MKLALLILMTASLTISAQGIIKKGSSVKVDGIVEKGEWDDAKEFLFTSTEKAKCRVLAKHDSKNLNLLYIMKEFKDSTIVMPEIFIDAKNDKGSTWQPDDYWFHVSAQDCYSAGKREDYTNCKVVGGKWNAAPNYPFGNNWKRIEEIEISIPLEFVQITKNKEFGLCFSLSIFPGELRKNIPAEAHEDKPNTWQSFIISE